MEKVFEKTVHIPASAVDRYDRLKPAMILDYLQEIAGDHCVLLHATRQELAEKNLFWAVIRHRVVINRPPRAGEDICLQTWPMPTTRTAYPRATVAKDADGNVLFECISLWVLMDMSTRAMVLPGKSGVTVEGHLRGCEIEPCGSMPMKERSRVDVRPVRFTDLDWNGHMNNCRYLDFVADLLDSSFHGQHPVKEFSLCYFAEAHEGDTMQLHWQLEETGLLSVDATRKDGASSTAEGRVFSARVHYENGVM